MAINLERFVKAKRFTEDHVLDDASDQILVKVATDSVAGKVALNAGTSLPGDATNCTDALTACGLNALLTDPAAGGNTVINNIKALAPSAPDATETVKGISELATTAEAAAGTSTTTVVTPAGLKAALDAAAPNLKTCSGADMAFDAQVPTCTEMNAAIAAAAPNGSETKVTAGTNTTVTGTGTTADPYVVNASGSASVPAASETVAGITRFATNAETVAGTVTTAAVHPQDMKYTLNTGQDYRVWVSAQGIFDVSAKTGTYKLGCLGYSSAATGDSGLSYGTVGYIISGTVETIYNYFCAGVRGGIETAVTIPSGKTAAGTLGYNAAGGAGIKPGVFGSSSGTGGGTNIGVYGLAQGGATNWAGYFDGNVAGGAYTTISDETLKENVEAIDPVKALQFRNGLQWKKYELFSEQQVQIMDAEGNATGRYEVKRTSQGIKRGLIAQEVLALAQSIGDFTDVVVEVGEYFTLDAQGYPVKDAQGNNIVNKRLGLDYDAVSFIVMCAEQSALIPA